MLKHILYFSAPIFVFLIAACSGTPQVEQPTLVPATLTPTMTPIPPTATATATLTPTPTVTPIPRRIGYTVDIQNNNTKSIICEINDDGSEQKCLTKREENNFSPAWSPDGKYIAFLSNIDRSRTDLYLMNADGSEPVKLSKTSHFAWKPTWSPDGSQIAYFSVASKGSFSITVVKPDGSDEKILAWNMSHGTFANVWYWLFNGPQWSPDGKQIAFMSAHETFRTGRLEIFVVDLESGEITRLTDSESHKFYPTWSPDGKQIAYYAANEQEWGLYVMNLDGSKQQRVADAVKSDGFLVLSPPAWSPDGSQIAFQSDRDGKLDIYITKADGSIQNKLAATEFNDAQITWSPDGKKIAFVAKPKDTSSDVLAIYIINSDGSGLNRLTKDTEKAYDPVWLP